jgi:serine/threonine protein kinase
LGRGNFSIVKRGIHRTTGIPVAIKIISKKRFWHITKSRTQIEREIQILSSISHPNIIQYRDVFVTDQELFIVLELASGGELFDRIVDGGPVCSSEGKPEFTFFFVVQIPEDEAATIFRQLLSAVDYLHSKGIAHRDIKVQNRHFFSLIFPA